MSFYLTTFASRHFRNLVGSPFQLHPQFNLFLGENGQGKTNLLEAVYYLFTLRPLRPVRPRDLLAWGEDEARVQGEVQGRVTRKMGASFTPKKRVVTLNGAPPIRLDDYFDGTQVVAFTPEEIQVIRGAPELRRRFMDRAIFNTYTPYLREVRQYLRVLSHRNALLKQDTRDEALLAVLDEQFVAHGARLILHRMFLIARLREQLKTTYSRIFPELDAEIDISYQASVSSLPEVSTQTPWEDVEEAVHQSFLRHLERVRRRELERRKTVVGPHLDDVHFTFDGKLFKHAASQGQTRALVLALKIAEIQEISSRNGQPPLLLLDDVAGELDPRHCALFFEFLSEASGQVLLTTTHLSYIPLPDVRSYPRFRLEQGEIH